MAVSVIQGCVCIFVLLIYLVLYHAHYTHNIQKNTAEFAKKALTRQRAARRCDLPSCNASAAELNIQRLAKCPRCRCAIYCGQQHAMLHLDDHESLCEELQRICDLPECEERAAIRCSECRVAAYCGTKHMRKHRAAHESVCRELCSLR